MEIIFHTFIVLELSWIANSFNVYEPARVPGWNYFGYSWMDQKPSFVFRKPMAAMVDLTNDLGIAILQDYSYSRSNFAFSPYGVASVLVVLYEGARGESARQIHRAVGFPWDKDITRIGFRDIHRHLRSYFSHEGYLSGITLSKDSSTLKAEYKRTLRFYGYDVDVDTPERTSDAPPITTVSSTSVVTPNATTPEGTEITTTGGYDATTGKDPEETNIAPSTIKPEDFTTSSSDEPMTTLTAMEDREPPVSPAETTVASYSTTGAEGAVTEATEVPMVATTELQNEGDEEISTEENLQGTEQTNQEDTQEDIEQSAAESTEPNAEQSTLGSVEEGSPQNIEPNTEQSTPESNTQEPEQDNLQVTEANTENQYTSEMHNETSTSEEDEKNSQEGDEYGEQATEQDSEQSTPSASVEVVETTNPSSTEQNNQQANEKGTEENAELVTEQNTEQSTQGSNEQELEANSQPYTEQNSDDEQDVPQETEENEEQVTPQAHEESTAGDTQQGTETITETTPLVTSPGKHSSAMTDPATESYESTPADVETFTSTDEVKDFTISTPINIEHELATLQEAEVVGNLTTEEGDRSSRSDGLDNGMLIPQLTNEQYLYFDDRFGFGIGNSDKRNAIDNTDEPEKTSEDWREIGVALIAEGDEVKWEPKTLDEFLKNLMREREIAEGVNRTGRLASGKRGRWKRHDWNSSRASSEEKASSKGPEISNKSSTRKGLPIDVGTSAKLKRRHSTKEKRNISEFLKIPPVTDLSLQLQNGMFDSHVSKNTDLYRVLPKFLFLVDGAIDTPVSMMTYTNVFPFAYIPRLHCKALEFPLDDERYKLLILLPVERRGLRQLIYDLGSYPLREVMNVLRPARVKAMVPTFMVEGFVILTPTLQKLGIWDVFDPRRADLSGMTSDPELYVRNIEQSVTVVIRNYVEILDIQTRTMAARHIDEDFTASHPFLYFVMDTATNVALMAGQMLDPLNSRIY